MHKINLKIGETYRLELGGLATSGYKWEYTIEGAQRIVDISREVVDDISQPPHNDHHPPSFNRQNIFTITALNLGVVFIRIFLQRPWERDSPPLTELCLKISVSN